MTTRDINNQFTGMVLVEMRKEAKKLGLGEEIKGLGTWSDRNRTNPDYEVFKGGRMVWGGTAYNASDAKTKYIDTLIREAEERAEV